MKETGQSAEPQDGDVLVVEDDPHVNQMVGAYAEICGFHYRSALTGAEALREAHRKPPSVVLLDVMLPDLNGWEVCHRLREDRQTRQVPVIIVTALTDQQERGKQCGASAYITKPFDPDHLMDVLRRSVRH